MVDTFRFFDAGFAEAFFVGAVARAVLGRDELDDDCEAFKAGGERDREGVAVEMLVAAESDELLREAELDLKTFEP